MPGLWDVLGGAIGGGLAYLGAREDQKAARQAAELQAATVNQAADRAIAAGEPYGVGSLGGTASFDPESKTALLNLSPELSDIYQGALGRSGLWGQQALEYGADPFATADMFYERTRDYYTPAEEKLRSDLETRLLSQGRLGSTGGRLQTQALEEAILRDQGRRRNESLSQAQALVQDLLGRESADIGTATGLLNVPLQQAKLGRGIGGDLGTLAASGLSSRASAARNLSDVLSAKESTGTLLAGAFGGMLPTWKSGNLVTSDMLRKNTIS